MTPTYTPNPTGVILGPGTPDVTNPRQGQLCNCPFLSAISSVCWVNKSYITNNMNYDSATGNYTIKFWDFSGMIPVTGKINPSGSAQKDVVVNSCVLLDDNRQPANSNGSYGASCNIANEWWPAIYEKAYAKFCLYRKSKSMSVPIVTEDDLKDATKNLNYSDVSGLTKPEWGGNGACALMYLTGLDCFISKSTDAFSPIGGASSGDFGKVYDFIRNGFCRESTVTTGYWKSKYPMVAWTYNSVSESPASGTISFDLDQNGQGSGNGIYANHCYSILGVFEKSTSKRRYIVLRNTFGMKDPITNPPVVAGNDEGDWSYYNPQFKIGLIAEQNPKSGVQVKQVPLNLSKVQNDGIFGLWEDEFVKYFSYLGWSRGYA